MAFNWEDFLKLAEELAGRTDSEAALRSAVSRAYYAAFMTARNFIEPARIGFSNPDEKHAAVWDRFIALGGTTRKAIGENGNRLRRKRNEADYENKINYKLSDSARESIRQANNILAWMKSLPSPDSKPS